MKTSKLSVFIVLSLFAYNCATDSPNHKQEISAELTKTERDSLILMGSGIAQTSAKALGSKLMSALGEGGVPYAVKFCSEQALPITDSLSKHFSVKVQRIAQRNRNPKNELDEESEKVFSRMEELVKSGKTPEPELIKHSNSINFYAPIVLKGMCVTCHGSVAEIGQSNLDLIRNKYPNDLAIDFNQGDLRGLWKITLK